MDPALAEPDTTQRLLGLGLCIAMPVLSLALSVLLAKTLLPFMWGRPWTLILVPLLLPILPLILVAFPIFWLTRKQPPSPEGAYEPYSPYDNTQPPMKDELHWEMKREKREREHQWKVEEFREEKGRDPNFFEELFL